MEYLIGAVVGCTLSIILMCLVQSGRGMNK